MRKLSDLPTPYLAIDLEIFYQNLETMGAYKSGSQLRPHVKAFKSTAVAAILKDFGYSNFCCATVREMEGMVAAGIANDILLAKDTFDTNRLGSLVDQGANITVAVDSAETIKAAFNGGVRNVLIDVNVGLPRCGCDISEVSQLSKYAKQIGLNVRGVMGYEGHLMFTESRDDRRDGVEISMSVLQEAHSITGGEVISAGGTGTFDLNSFATEIQAGSFLFMDTRYASLDLPFLESLWVVSKVISVEKDRRRAVCDAGVKSFSMDYGKPSLEDCVIGFCSDEHTVILPKEKEGTINFKVGDLVQLRTSHVDPTVAKHPKLFGVIDGLVHEEWKVDLRDW